MTSNPAIPLIGFGQVRHTRLRPAYNAFAYATYFLMLPMRTCNISRRLRCHTHLPSTGVQR